jgi:hypothetical protein
VIKTSTLEMPIAVKLDMYVSYTGKQSPSESHVFVSSFGVLNKWSKRFFEESVFTLKKKLTWKSKSDHDFVHRCTAFTNHPTVVKHSSKPWSQGTCIAIGEPPNKVRWPAFLKSPLRRRWQLKEDPDQLSSIWNSAMWGNNSYVHCISGT